MMVAPETYIDEMKNRSLEECLAERDEIYETLKMVETGAYDESEITTTIHPARQYSWYLTVFALLNELILEKFNQARDEYE